MAASFRRCVRPGRTGHRWRQSDERLLRRWRMWRQRSECCAWRFSQSVMTRRQKLEEKQGSMKFAKMDQRGSSGESSHRSSGRPWRDRPRRRPAESPHPGGSARRMSLVPSWENPAPGSRRDEERTAAPEVRAPKRLSTANIEPWPLAAMRARISRASRPIPAE